MVTVGQEFRTILSEHLWLTFSREVIRQGCIIWSLDCRWGIHFQAPWVPCWMLVIEWGRTSAPHHPDLPTGLLECPHTMVASLPQSKWSERELGGGHDTFYNPLSEAWDHHFRHILFVWVTKSPSTQGCGIRVHPPCSAPLPCAPTPPLPFAFPLPSSTLSGPHFPISTSRGNLLPSWGYCENKVRHTVWKDT